MSDLRPEFRVPLSARKDRRKRTYHIAHLNFPAMLHTQGMTVFVMTECRDPVIVFRPTSGREFREDSVVESPEEASDTETSESSEA